MRSDASLFRQNNDLLSPRFASLIRFISTWDGEFLDEAVTPARKTGDPVFQWEGRQIHSAVDPRREAQAKWREISIDHFNRFFFVPADFLYSFEYLTEEKRLEEVDPGARFYFFFHDPKIFLLLLHHRDLSFLSPSLDRCFFYLQGHNSLVLEDLDIPRIKGAVFLENRSLTLLCPGYEENIRRAYYQSTENWYASNLTQFYFEKKRIQNGLNNLKAASSMYSLKDMVGIGTGAPCHLVGAGPSLYSTVANLRRVHRREVILCSDTALRPLLLGGIEPDYVVALDSGYFNYLDFQISLPQNLILFCDLFVYPSIPRRFEGRAYLFASHPRGEEIGETLAFDLLSHFGMDESIPFLETRGSIAHTLISLARFLGFTSAHLWGMDFCSPFFHSHVFSSSHFVYFYDRAHRLAPIETQDFELICPGLEEKKRNNRGETVYSEKMMRLYAQGIEEMADVFTMNENHSPHGLMLEGWPPRPPRETFEARKIPDKMISSAKPLDVLDFSHLTDSVKTLLKKTAELLKVIELKQVDRVDTLIDGIEREMQSVKFFKQISGRIAFSIRRRRENPYFQIYVLYRDLFRYLTAVDRKILFREK